MSRTHRRTISWLALAALVAATAIGLTRLPGYGGVVAELRWLLARDNIPPELFNRASGLILLAEEHSPGARAELYRALFRDDDRRVLRGAMTVLADQLRHSGDPSGEIRQVLGDWFQHAAAEEKVACLPHLLHCLVYAQFSAARPQSWVAGLGLGRDLWWEPLLTPDDERWMVAATLPSPLDSWRMAHMLVFSGHRRGLAVSHSLFALDWLPGAPQVGPVRAIDIDEALRAELRIELERIEAMLNDPIDEVRWAAGRILAVCGDERGLPAFREWLQTTRGLTPEVDKLIADLFGPNWRDACESGGTTRQSGVRDR